MIKRNTAYSEMALYESMPVRTPPHGIPPMPGFPAMPGGGGEEGGNGASLWRTLDDRMRGRWRWAILVGVLLSAILALVGYFTTSPKYRSLGAVRVLAQVPAVLQETQLHIQRDYERFRATQIHMMKNDRVLERVLNDPDVVKLAWAQQSNALRKLKANLNVEADHDSQLIFVWFDADDPITAQTVTNSVLRSYYDVYGQYNGQDVPGTLAELKDNEAKYMRDLNSLQMDRRAIDAKYETSDLAELQRSNMKLLADLESQIRTGKRSLQRQAEQKAETGESPADIAPDLQTLAQINPMLGIRQQEWSQAQVAFDNVRVSHHGGSLYDNAKEHVDRAKKLYDDEFQKTVAEWKASGVRLSSNGPRVLTADDLKALQTEFKEISDRQQKLVGDMARREDLVFNEDAAQKEVESIRDRIRTLEIESKSLGEFISIAHFGGRENEPYQNGRRKRAIMGAALGLLASFGGFFLLGSIDRRAFGASQFQTRPGLRGPACLGVLPDLGMTLRDPESSEVASHCVHQIRNQIEALRDSKSGFVLAVSSPFQGDGKTSIVMALGWSYAAAGYNTLVIDCDLVGRSLTRQLGLIGREGLKDALINGELNGSVSRMPVEHLSAVPAGIDAAFGPENVRRKDLDHLLDQVRDKFDVILIDTGPMLGSLESTPVTAAADGVLLSVRRGRSRTRLEDCVARLEMMGANCLGIVLNCAGRWDCYRYVSEASLAAAEEERLGRQAGDGSAPPGEPARGERNALVRAMQHSTRVPRQRV